MWRIPGWRSRSPPRPCATSSRRSSRRKGPRWTPRGPRFHSIRGGLRSHLVAEQLLGFLSGLLPLADAAHEPVRLGLAGARLAQDDRGEGSSRNGDGLRLRQHRPQVPRRLRAGRLARLLLRLLVDLDPARALDGVLGRHVDVELGRVPPLIVLGGRGSGLEGLLAVAHDARARHDLPAQGDGSRALARRHPVGPLPLEGSRAAHGFQRPHRGLLLPHPTPPPPPARPPPPPARGPARPAAPPPPPPPPAPGAGVEGGVGSQSAARGDESRQEEGAPCAAAHWPRPGWGRACLMMAFGVSPGSPSNLNSTSMAYQPELPEAGP